MPRKVYVVEDYQRLRETILDLIACSAELETAGSSGTAESALEDLPDLEIDLMLIDVSLPGQSGLELLSEVRRRRPNIFCVMVSGHRSVAYAERAKNAGASAYVVKSDLYRLPKILLDVGQRDGAFQAYGLG